MESMEDRLSYGAMILGGLLYYVAATAYIANKLTSILS